MTAPTSADVCKGIVRYAVLYVAGGKERRSPWFQSRNRAEQARRLITAKYGAAVVYVD